MNKEALKEKLESFNEGEEELYDRINYVDTQSNKFNKSDRIELILKSMYLFHKLYGIENIRDNLNMPTKVDKNISYQQFVEYLEGLKQYKYSLPMRSEVKTYCDLLIYSCLNRLLNMTDPIWTKIYSSKITKNNEIDVLGKMYLSVDNKDLYRFAILLLEGCLEQGIDEFEFKVNNDENVTRCDNIVIYFTETNFNKYISLITQIIKDNSQIKLNTQNVLGYSINENICIAKDYNGGSESYTQKVCDVIALLKGKGWTDDQVIAAVE